MTTATYVARRGIQSGHSSGVSYAFDFFPTVLDRTRDTIGSESISLSGRPQNIIDRRDDFWVISTDHIAADTQAYLDLFEFLESVDEKEVFSLDFYGTLSAPIATASCILKSNYTMQRFEQTNEFIFSFQVRVLP